MKFYKKICLAATFALATGFGASAQNLLDENFNGSFPPSGWTVIDSDLPNAINHWEQYTDTRTGITSAHVKGGEYSLIEPVKEEILISPVVDLNGYYDLQFVWEGATAASINKQEYDFQVRVAEENSDNWTTIFSIIDEDMVRNSGIAYPWQAWVYNPASINLTDWSGKKVRFAFVHCLLKTGSTGLGNDIWLDDVKITPSTQISGPVATVSPESYIFPTTFIGAKKYSETITLKNTGKDVLTVSGVNGLDGTDFGCTLVPSEVSLKTGDTYEFTFWYEPTMSGSARATATIATNGGDVTFALSGTKTVLSEGSTYEGFEGEVFPPLGWSQKGAWYQYSYGLTGDHSAICSFPDSGSELVTPRLDLSGSDDTVPFQFTYFEQYDPMYDDQSAPANFFRVYFSNDGRSKWTKIWDSYDSLNEDGELFELNAINTVRLELPGGSDNCYIKFVSEIPNFSMGDYDDMPDYSMVYVDDVLLPALYGSAEAPASSSAVNPKDGAKDVFHKNLTLEWTGALFASNYKLYLGTSATDFDVIDGLDMGTATSYTVDRLEYATTYYWKVVAYNGTVANTTAPTWSFTVMADQSVKELPYSQNFDDNKNAFPLGWNSVNEGYTRWQISDYSPYSGKGFTPYASGNVLNSKAVLETPEITLPAEGDILASFVWGNAAPVGLHVDATGEKVNNTKTANDQSAIYFDIEVDGQWKQLGILSEKGEDLCWYRESFPLNEYAGKAVTFRWRYEVYGYSANSASIDNFLVEVTSKDKAMAVFNIEAWDAANVNNGDKVTSRHPILLSNIGATPLKVRSASFTTSNFSSDLAAGTEIAPNRTAAFYLTYDAGMTEGKVNDEMVVAFENGTSVSLPVSGTTLAPDVFYYDFERDEHASTQPIDFTTIDVDGRATVEPVLIYYPKRGAPFAYIVLNITGDYADWRNVYPVSGEQVLASMSDMTGSYETDDWIISPQLTATGQSNFRFYAKCYGDESQVFSQNRVEVLVSTSGKNTSDFETVRASEKLPWSGSEGKWTEYNVDLSKYEGQKIYVAVRHKADKDGFVSFFDDFWFEHFAGRNSGLDCIGSATEDGSVELYDLNGVRVNPATATPGIYIRKAAGKTEKTIIK